MLTEAVSLYNITASRADVRTPKPSCCLQLSPLSDVFRSVLQPGMKVWAVPAPLQTCLCACGATPVPTKSWKPEATSPVLLLQLGCWKEELDSLGDWAHNPLILLHTYSAVTPRPVGLGVRIVTAPMYYSYPKNEAKPGGFLFVPNEYQINWGV